MSAYIYGAAVAILFCLVSYAGSIEHRPLPLRPEDMVSEPMGPAEPHLVVKDFVCIYQGRGQWGSCREISKPE